MLEASQQGMRREDRDPGHRQLDREWEPVQPGADRIDDGGQLVRHRKRWDQPLRSIGEELPRSLGGE